MDLIPVSLFSYSYSNNGDRLRDQHYPSKSSSSSLTDPDYLQNQGSNLASITETEAKEQPKPKSPFIKRILLVDDDPDVILTFKAGLDGHYYGTVTRRKDLKYTHITILY